MQHVYLCYINLHKLNIYTRKLCVFLTFSPNHATIVDEILVIFYRPPVPTYHHFPLRVCLAT